LKDIAGKLSISYDDKTKFENLQVSILDMLGAKLNTSDQNGTMSSLESDLSPLMK